MSTLGSSSDNPIFDELLAEFEQQTAKATGTAPVPKKAAPRKRVAAKSTKAALGKGIAALIPTEPKEDK